MCTVEGPRIETIFICYIELQNIFMLERLERALPKLDKVRVRVRHLTEFWHERWWHMIQKFNIEEDVVYVIAACSYRIDSIIKNELYGNRMGFIIIN